MGLGPGVKVGPGGVKDRSLKNAMSRAPGATRTWLAISNNAFISIIIAHAYLPTIDTRVLLFVRYPGGAYYYYHFNDPGGLKLPPGVLFTPCGLPK